MVQVIEIFCILLMHMILFARYVATPRRSVFSMRSDNSQSYAHQISRSLDHHNARAQDAPERRAVPAEVSCSQAKIMAFPKLALLLALAGARAADDDQVVVGQTFTRSARASASCSPRSPPP